MKNPDRLADRLGPGAAALAALRPDGKEWRQRQCSVKTDIPNPA